MLVCRWFLLKRRLELGEVFPAVISLHLQLLSEQLVKSVDVILHIRLPVAGKVIGVTMKPNFHVVMCIFGAFAAVLIHSTLGVFMGPCPTTYNKLGFLEPCSSTAADFVVGGFVFVSGRWNSKTGTCENLGQDAFQIAEAARHAVDLFNERTRQAGVGVTFGYEFHAACAGKPQRSYQLETLNFIQRTGITAASDEECPKTASDLRSIRSALLVKNRQTPPVSAVLGPPTSSTTAEMASLAALFQLPVVSYAATAPSLGNTCDYPYFLRLVPSDTEQVEVITEFIKRQGWTYLDVVADKGLYAQSLVKSLVSAAEYRNICIGAYVVLDEEPDADIYRLLLSTILKRQGGGGSDSSSNSSVMLIVTQRSIFTSYIRFLEATMGNLYRPSDTTYLATDTWAFLPSLIPEGLVREMRGTIGFAPRPRTGKRILDHLLAAHPSNNNNPFLIPSWEATFNCSLSEEASDEERDLCSTNKFVLDETLNPQVKISISFDAVQGMLEAMNRTFHEMCRVQFDVKECNPAYQRLAATFFRVSRLSGPRVLANLRENTIESFLDGVKTAFDPNSNNPKGVSYALGNAQEIDGGTAIHYVEFGTGNVLHERNTHDSAACFVETGQTRQSDEFDVQLKTNDSLIIWNDLTRNTPVSICSPPCLPGHSPIPHINEDSTISRCCFDCLLCTGHSYSAGGKQSCTICADTAKVNHDHTACIKLPVEYYGKTTQALAFFTISMFVAAAALVIMIFIILRPDLPWAMRRPLLLIIGVATLFEQGANGALLLEPGTVMCNAGSIVANCCVIIALSPLLVMAVHRSRFGAKAGQNTSDYITSSHASSSDMTSKPTSSETDGRRDVDTSVSKGELTSFNGNRLNDNRTLHVNSDLQVSMESYDPSIGTPTPRASPVDRLHHVSDYLQTDEVRRPSRLRFNIEERPIGWNKKSPPATKRSPRRRRAKRILSGLLSKVVFSLVLALFLVALVISVHVIDPVSHKITITPHSRVILSCSADHTSARIGYIFYSVMGLVIIFLDAITLYQARQKQRHLSTRVKFSAQRRIFVSGSILFSFVFGLTLYFMIGDDVSRFTGLGIVFTLYGVVLFAMVLFAETWQALHYRQKGERNPQSSSGDTSRGISSATQSSGGEQSRNGSLQPDVRELR